MRRRRVLLCLAAALPASLVAAPPAAALPDLVVSSAAEPPDFELAGGRFRHSYTVANNGNQTARSSRTTSFLSADPVRGEGDFALRGSARTSSLFDALRARRQKTRRITLNIPDDVPPGFYFLIECADGNGVVRESSERNNCRTSGQRVGINATERGQAGPVGPAGPPGPPGRSIDRRRMPRTVLDLGTKTARPNPADIGSDEGSTSTQELAKVGPISVHALCRATTNGDSDEPGAPFGPTGGFDQDGDEAKILLFADAGSFSFEGLHGPRTDVPAGGGTPDNEDQTGGEGKRQFLATARDPDPNTTTGNAQGEVLEREWAFAFRSVSGWVSHSNGMELIVTAYAGIDVLGVGDRCVFGGLVTVVSAGAA